MKHFHTDDVWESLADKGRAEVELYHTDVEQFREELNAEAVEEGVSLRYNTFVNSSNSFFITVKIYLRKSNRGMDND